MRSLLLLLLATLFAAAPVQAQDAQSPFTAPAISDEALAELRGGFALPGGIDVAVAVQSDTRVNGVLLLRSVFVLDRGPATLAVFGRTDGGLVAGLPTSNPAGSTTTLTVTNKAGTIGGAAEGLVRLSFGSDGAPIAASGGAVRVEQAGAQSRVILSQPTLAVTHLAGQSYGSITANRGSDVAIDTTTLINVDLRGASPLNIGSAAFRIDALALETAMRLGR